MTPPTPPAGLHLAIETSSPRGSVALGTGRRLIGRRVLRRPESHSAELVPRIRDLLEETGVGGEELEGLVVGAGPGSFTGVRVAAATVKGFAHVHRLPVRAFSSLAAAAVPQDLVPAGPGGGRKGTAPDEGGSVPEKDRARYVLFDARGGRLYAACYRFRRTGREWGIEVAAPPHAAHIDTLLEGDVPPGALFLGDGAAAHREQLRAGGFTVLAPPAGVPSADALLRLLRLDPEASPIEDLPRWEPRYLRVTGAERMRSGESAAR